MPLNTHTGDAGLRVVLDTNVVIDSTNDPLNAASQLLDAVFEGTITALGTPATKREYDTIANRFVISDEDEDRITGYLARLEMVPAAHVDVVIDDQEDYKFLQAAVGGEADLLVTSDKHLLDIGEVDGMRIVRPTEALALMEDTSSSSGEWQSWVQGLGIQ